METNFFNQLAQLEFTGSLQLIIAKGAETNLVVSVLLLNEQCGDEAKHLIPPVTLRASAEDLDKDFFNHITTPVQTVSGLMVDMEAFLKQVEAAKKQSAMEKEKADREKKEKDLKEKKFRDAITRVEELEKAGKYREAWLKVPDPVAYPEHAEAIRKRKAELSEQFAPDLFGSASGEQPGNAESEAETQLPEVTGNDGNPDESQTDF